ncbi:uncharacterized protein LOC144433617 [Glandiceps talaboti]
MEQMKKCLVQALEEGTPITSVELLLSQGQKSIKDMRYVVYNVAKKYILKHGTRESAVRVILTFPELSIGRVNSIAKTKGIEPFQLDIRKTMYNTDTVAEWIRVKLQERKLLTLDILQVTFPKFYRKELRRHLYAEVWNYLLSTRDSNEDIEETELQQMLPDIPEEVILSFLHDNQDNGDDDSNSQDNVTHQVPDTVHAHHTSSLPLLICPGNGN